MALAHVDHVPAEIAQGRILNLLSEELAFIDAELLIAQDLLELEFLHLTESTTLVHCVTPPGLKFAQC